MFQDPEQAEVVGGGGRRVAMGREEVRLTLEANGSSEMVLPRAMSEERLRR